MTDDLAGTNAADATFDGFRFVVLRSDAAEPLRKRFFLTIHRNRDDAFAAIVRHTTGRDRAMLLKWGAATLGEARALGVRDGEVGEIAS